MIVLTVLLPWYWIYHRYLLSFISSILNITHNRRFAKDIVVLLLLFFIKIIYPLRILNAISNTILCCKWYFWNMFLIKLRLNYFKCKCTVHLLHLYNTCSIIINCLRRLSLILWILIGSGLRVSIIIIKITLLYWI